MDPDELIGYHASTLAMVHCTVLKIIYLPIRRTWKTITFNPRPPLPPSVPDLINDRSSVGRRHPYRDHPAFPGNHFPDSPLASLYRLYEFFVIDRATSFRTEAEWFRENAKWAVHDIPDPKDTDPLRYAILAGLTEVLAFGFNWLVNQGLPRGLLIYSSEILAAQPKEFETPPEWALKVAPLAEKVFVPNEKGQVVKEEHSYYAVRKFNIYIESHCSLHLVG